MNTYNIPDDYVLGTGEINNIVYLTCKYACGWPMRQADLAICDMMRDKALRGDVAVENLLVVTAEYVWNHIAGEPDSYTQQQFADYVRPILIDWYKNTTVEDRHDIGPACTN